MANPIDTKTIGKLAEMLNKNNLSELEYEDESCRIHLKGATAATQNIPAPFIPTAPTVQSHPTPTLSSDTTIPSDDHTSNPGTVKSPIVGVVYLAPDPTKPDYVSVGDTVKEGDIVCLIEAMKTFNPVKAHRSGTVSKILVESGDPVEYGESLLIIE